MKRISLLTIGSLLFLLLATPQQSVADEEILIEESIVCPTEPVGLVQTKSLNSGIAFDCIQQAWEVYEVKSRVNSSYSIYNAVVQQFQNRTRSDRDITYSLELNCKAKRLRANLYVESSEMIEGYGVSYRIKTDQFKMGLVSVKFDNANFKKFKYLEPKDEPVFIQDSKIFTSALLKTKGKFVIKLSTVELGNTAIDFPILDISKYKTKFKSLGCPLS